MDMIMFTIHMHLMRTYIEYYVLMHMQSNPYALTGDNSFPVTKVISRKP